MLRLFRLLVLLCLPLLAQAQVLHVDGSQERLALWPAVRVLPEPVGTPELTLQAARARAAQMAAPTTATNTLGHRREAKWLRIALRTGADGGGRWVLNLDYAMLNRVDVYLLDAQGRELQPLQRVGNLQPERALPSRTPAVELRLLPEAEHEIWLRVQTTGALILPITLSREGPFLAAQLAEQTLQGLLTGLALCLVLYSLAQWLSLRERLLLKYALLTGASMMFSVVQFGLGNQYLWPGLGAITLWAELHGAGISALLASAGTFLFVEEVLREPHGSGAGQGWRWFSPLMKTGAALLALTAAAFAIDLIDVHAVSRVIGTLGLAPALLGLPGALRRLRRGDSVGAYFLVAWLGYFFTTAVMIATIRGTLPANAWTLHSFQAGATLDMLLFLRVLALRLHAVHEQAARAAVERDQALDLAATDALTGLPNRRGLDRALHDALAGDAPCAVFLIDLDGFKAVNDAHGHETGDALLKAVGQRLRAQLRAGDVVARLGGDEFVVLAPGLQTPQLAELLGEAIQRAFDTPFDINGLALSLGASTGYALGPQDGHEAAQLLQRADAAMYAGKRTSGGGRLARAGRPV